jgi:hypothetical protein
MSKLLEAAMVEKGWDKSPRNTAAGRRADFVSQGSEFLRIRALPRRRWQDDPALDKLVDLLTKRLRLPGTPPDHIPARLFPHQAAALQDWFNLECVYPVVDVGGGKTLLSYLLPVLIDSPRALLLTGANLIGKTEREFAELSQYWKSAKEWKYLSFEKLSRNDKLLYEYLPTVIVADESFALKSPKSGRTKKLLRFLATHQSCRFVSLTATPGDQSINEWSHLVHAGLGPARAPVPAPGSWEACQWGQALDVNVNGPRRSPGALELFNEKATSLDDIRAGVGRRVSETPGVIYHRVSEVPCSLYLSALVFDESTPELDKVFEHIRTTGDELPDGRVIETPIERYQLLATLPLGFVRVIDPPPPDDWRAARRLWTAFANQVIDQDIPGLDTPGAVALACQNRLVDSFGVYEDWVTIKPSFEPKSTVVWFDDTALRRVTTWMNENDGVVFVPFPAFGDKLSEMSGRPFYHEGGLNKDGVSIEQHPGTDSVIASTGANHKGRNLQFKWSKMLILGSGSSSVVLHQQIGRCHRTGQKADAVEVEFFIGSTEDLRAVWKARARATYDKTLGENESHKLRLGDFLLPEKIDLDSPRFQS